MKKLSAVVLLIVLCCSACSFQSKPGIVSSVDESSANLSSLPDNETSSLPAQEDAHAESGFPATTPDYQGLTREQWQTIQSQKEVYGDLSDKELQQATFNGQIECPNFTHLYWEDSIDIFFARHVGLDEFEQWLSEREHAGKCADIYSFAEHFSIGQEELVSLIEENHLTEVYDLETVKNRYTYFIDLKNDNAE